MRIELRSDAFDPWSELPAFESERLTRGGYGATASFVGTMRDFNDGRAVERLFLEHYPRMTERQLERIVGAELERHGVPEALVIHRVGWLDPGEPIVLVATWAAHRGPAFAACRAIMEALKSDAPFWKREVGDDGAHWVAHNTPG